MTECVAGVRPEPHKLNAVSIVMAIHEARSHRVSVPRGIDTLVTKAATALYSTLRTSAVDTQAVGIEQNYAIRPLVTFSEHHALAINVCDRVQWVLFGLNCTVQQRGAGMRGYRQPRWSGESLNMRQTSLLQ